MGKTLAPQWTEAVKCAWVCRYYAENAERFLADEPAGNTREPQFYSLPAHGAGPRNHAVELSILAGFSIYRSWIDGGERGLALKHASNVPQCAMRIEEHCGRDSACPKEYSKLFLIGWAAWTEFSPTLASRRPR